MFTVFLIVLEHFVDLSVFIWMFQQKPTKGNNFVNHMEKRFMQLFPLYILQIHRQCTFVKLVDT